MLFSAGLASLTGSRKGQANDTRQWMWQICTFWWQLSSEQISSNIKPSSRVQSLKFKIKQNQNRHAHITTFLLFRSHFMKCFVKRLYNLPTAAPSILLMVFQKCFRCESCFLRDHQAVSQPLAVVIAKVPVTPHKALLCQGQTELKSL